ncbi:MAG: endonuclease MutS2 [Chloroflexi bacterium]|nr:endonuclease MutS2 [Chloroflexota bacterium]
MAGATNRDPPRTQRGQELRQRSLELLEFPRVREALAEHTRLPMSRERALSLTPSYEADVVRELQQETAEARLLLEEGSGVDLSLGRDPRPLLKRVALGSVLAGDELVAIADALETARAAKAIGNRLRAKTPLVRALARSITDLRPLERQLRAKLTPAGELKDDATPYLRELRHEARETYGRAKGSLEALVDSELGAEVLQERLFTVRSDRLVVPVKAEMRARLPGIVHGVSDSGATLFIEPLANVDRTNAWREAVAAEAQETLRILRRLSADVGKRAGDIGHALEIAARIDLALAKARYGRAYDGVAVDGDGPIRLVEARHPLLRGGAVPVSLDLAPPSSTLVVTGPNMGGKTVALKTLGLLVLMRQAGLLLPCGRSTTLPLVDGVYADIGDQQSIEQDVSTFSSHVSNIAGVLVEATDRSLVLLDELGTSTDPEEGSALARAILAHLSERAVPTLVTTHHRSVAAFAEEQAGMENASVELDPVTLEPTYRITMGLPGRSYALAVAERIGLDARVIEAARRLQDPVHREGEELLATIQEERHRTRARLAEAEAAERHASELARELEERLAEAADAQSEAIEAVRRELAAEARRVLARLKQAEAAASWEAFRGDPPPPRVLEEARGDVADVQRMVRSRLWGRPKAAARASRRSISVGDRVEIGALGFTGEVLTAPGEDAKVDVLVGSARIRLETSRLRKVGEGTPRPPSTTHVTLSPKEHIAADGAELDIRGLRLHEALARVDAYLDSALAQGVRRVRIVHGKGTGALRQGVWHHLASHPTGATFDFAPPERGGDGATEVELV